MFVAFTLLSACQQDVLLALGDPTGVNIAPMSTSEAEMLSLDARPSNTSLLIRPTVTVPTEPVKPVVHTDLSTKISAEAIAGGPSVPTTQAFSPISIPEDGPETTGVRWEGVKRKGTNRPPSTVRMKGGRPVD